MPSLEQSEKIESTSSQILCKSSNKEEAENAMVLKIGNVIIGKPEMPPRIFRREGSRPSRKDVKKTLNIEKTQREHGWTLKYCIFLDRLKTVNIDCEATWDERSRYQNQFVLIWQDEKNPGKMSIQDYFKKVARSLATVSHQERRENAKIPLSG